MTDEHLIGWLCILRLNWGCSNKFSMPGCVKQALVDRGWLEINPLHGARLTDAGCTVTDLNAPAWGIDSLNLEEYEEEDA